MEPTRQFVRRDGRRFVVGDQEFKFVGFNMRGLAHYGDTNVLPTSAHEQRAEFLAEAGAAGSTVVRLFLPHSTVHPDQALVERLGQVLELAVAHRQRVIVCLVDHLETSRFQHWSFFKEDGAPRQGYIYTDKNGQNVLSPTFYRELYQHPPFLDYVRTVVSANKDHPAVFCWELTNEGSDHEGHDDFINYCTYMADLIRGIDPNHLITAGIISTPVIEFKNEGGNDEPSRLYERLDFLTVHDYDQISSQDRHLAARLDKPLIVEEVGRKDGRAGFFRENMDFWFHNGAGGYLGWGFMPSAEDNGDGDQDFGIDRALHGDYDEVTQIWKDWAGRLPKVPPPASP
jgi:hypothetical protein